MNNVNQFPLLKLPLVGLLHVLSIFQFPDMINFSFVSKRCHFFISSLKSPTSGRITISKSCVAIRLNWFRIDRSWLEAWFFNNRDFEEEGVNAPVVFSIDGCEFRNLYVQNYELHSFGNLQQCMNAAIKYLKEMFKFLRFEVCYYPDDIPLSRYPLLVDCQDCIELKVGGVKKMKDEEVLKEILKFHKPTESMSLCIPTSWNFQSNLALWGNPKSLCSYYNSDWVTNEMLLNAKSEVIILHGCRMTAENCRFFVKRWFDSDDVSFKYLQLSWRDEFLPVNLNFKNLGFQLKPFDERVRNDAFVVFPKMAVDVTDGFDFVRKDGLLATVMIEESYFIFCVWHERFPKIDEMCRTETVIWPYFF